MKNKIKIILLIFCINNLISCFTFKENISKKNSNNNIYQDTLVFNNKIINDSISIDKEQYKKYPIKEINSSNNIKTILCHKLEDQLSLPIINLNSNEKIKVSFDDLNVNIKEYFYTIIHCNSDWTESDIMQSEYIIGFSKNPITDYEFSFNTIQKYTHYQFTFPNNNIKPRISGNYVFKIFTLDNNIVAYKRFMVLDNIISIDANVKRATLAKNRNEKHEIDFSIKHPNIKIANPFSDIKVIIKQNNRNDNSLTELQPLFIKKDELDYDYDDENTILGNNEFRYFDIKSLRYHSDKVKSIITDSTGNNVYLFNDKSKSFLRYSIEKDLNGNYWIESQEARNSNIEADYTFVHFKLPSDHISYGNLYIIGKFSDWELKEEYKLTYNHKEKSYENQIYLKQGYYNYHYAIHDTNNNEIDVSFIEGTHYQTRNDYYIYVYYRDNTIMYDRLIGFLKTSSKELF